MYVNVKLLNGFAQTLTYKIPDNWNTKTVVGAIILVPLQKRTEQAIIINFFKQLPHPVTYAIKEALAITDFPEDSLWYDFIQKISTYYALNSTYFYQRIQNFLDDKEVKKYETQPLINRQSSISHPTEEQKNVIDYIDPYIQKPSYAPILLHGVTGSGKTEIYKHAIMQAHNNNQSILFLVPEVTLAVRFATLFKTELSFISVYGFHSASSKKEKKEVWNNALNKKPQLIVGVHLPVLIPLSNLGLIIIDEEHDQSFQEKKHPKINTKEIALLRAQLYKIPIILGSATPSITSLYNVDHKKWHYCTLKNRFAGAFPTIKTVKINDNKEYRKNFWITKELERAIHDRLHKKEQTIIFMNRRGYSFFIQCSLCGFIFECPSCSVSLTLHNKDILKCHYCNYQQIAPNKCSSCTGDQKNLIKKGIGTQQVVTLLEKIFPLAIIARCDMDSTLNKKKWEKIVSDFTHKKIDILVGTQSITKGYHFPGVTLVGLLWADINLSLPFYNASEIALQQIIQVAGRAGRQSQESMVIVQTMTNHPIFDYLHEHDYKKFYTYEINTRKELLYPPYIRFADIELRHKNATLLDNECIKCIKILQETIIKTDAFFKVMGPVEPIIHKVNNIFIQKIYLKSSNYETIINAYQKILTLPLASQIFFTPNPQQ